MSDIDAIRERHVEATFLGPNRDADWQACRECSQSWPCDTRVVLDALDEAEKHRRLASESYFEAWRKAEADAERLASALRDAIDIAHETDSLRSHSDDERKDGWFRAPLYRCTDATCEEATAVLAAHDARVKE